MEMRPGPPSGQRPEIRLSHAERDRATEVLAKHCSEGRLTLEEFSQRVEVVLAARTQGELDRVLADLPVDAPPYQSPIPTSSSFVAVFSGASQKGRWRPGRTLKATAVFGGVDLDLRNAEIDHPEIEIRAVAVFGGIDVIVPEGVVVDLSGGFSLFGGKDLKVSDAPPLPGGPVIKVRAYPVFGGVSVRSKRSPRRMIDEIRTAIDARSSDTSPRARRSGPTSAVPPPKGAGRHKNERILDARDALALAVDIIDTMFPRSGAPQPAAPGGPPPPQTAPDGTVTILFSDVSGFTEITERLGDQESQRLLQTYFQIVRGQIAAHGGYEVKCHGDEAMLAFGDPRQAIRCAVDIQRSLDRYNTRRDGNPIRVHIGLHTGQAIVDGGDFLGRTVILASRITDAAGADEILVSATLRRATAEAGDLSFGELRTVELQGVSDLQELYPVLWS